MGSFLLEQTTRASNSLPAAPFFDLSLRRGRKTRARESSTQPFYRLRLVGTKPEIVQLVAPKDLLLALNHSDHRLASISVYGSPAVPVQSILR